MISTNRWEPWEKGDLAPPVWWILSSWGKEGFTELPHSSSAEVVYDTI